MPQTINTFVKSKMNKDLDDRLLSNGEYRDAQNVNVSRSEGEDVGALENVLGNTLLSDFGLSTVPGLEIIGFLADEVNNRAFFCYILMRDNKTSTSSILVQGRFLNFSKTHHIYGIDLIEDLLFWTDNRNQPRKINVTKAIADNSYYNSEDLISVAKYYPYEAMDLYTKVDVTTISAATSNLEFKVSNTDLEKLNPGMILLRNYAGASTSPFLAFIEKINQPSGGSFGEVFLNKATTPSLTSTGGDTLTFISHGLQNASDLWLPPSSTAVYAGQTSTTPSQINLRHISGEMPKVGMRLTNPNNRGVNSYTDNLLVDSIVSSSNSIATITLSVADISTDYNYNVGDIIEFSSVNGYAKSNWPGDSEFLKEKFVRFAYRFKYEDGEYSLISPFTQPAFVPKQQGYFIDKPSANNVQEYLTEEEVAGSSTIVSFFENNVNNVFLSINTPLQVRRMADSFGITEIDILYKESDSLAVRVLETIPVTDSSITGNATNIYTYNYQSRKPFRTLPNKEVTRVFDKVPIRAMSQSIVGNRVVYGNFIDKHSPPINLEYNVSANEKYKSYYSSTAIEVRNYSRVSYPTHTLKQNRTYQVGVVLADRYGRQSDVILSSLDNSQFTQTGDSTVFGGSTYYHPYRTFLQGGTLSEWPGDSLKVLFRSAIPTTQTGEYEEGYPGLYSDGLETAEVRGAGGTNSVIPVKRFSPNIVPGSILQQSGNTYVVISVNRLNNSTSTITISESISFSGGDILTFKVPENKLGWYSYKIVVKQTEQEYYNVYLPNVCKTNPSSSLVISPAFPNEFLNNQSFFTSLLSDNINKISSDLQEVQPEQTQFRTSNDILYPRVGYNPDIGDNATVFTNYAANYYVGKDFATVDNIAKVTDMGVQLVNRDSVDLGRIKGYTFNTVTAQDYFSGGGTGLYAGQNLTDFGTVAGDVVYNFPGVAVTLDADGFSSANQQVSPIAMKIKVNTVNGNPSLNYLVITQGGVDIDKFDFIFVPALSPSSGFYKEGMSQWDEFYLPRKEDVINQGWPFLNAGDKIEITGVDEGWTISTETGTDVLPLSAPGIYNASSNPSLANLSVDGKFIIGGESNDNNVFSVFEIKPLDSKLELFWETSTSGLISDLNFEIENSAPSGSVNPEFPVE